MFSMIALFWALCILCIINMMRYFSSLRVLLYILRDTDPLLYQSVDGNGFFTTHGQFNKQLKLIRYINNKQYLDHFDSEVIRRCDRIRNQFLHISQLSVLVVVSLAYLLIAS
ncbi:universal stress protein UspB [Providencia burhodogranariea]|uniref:Universal stress protein B n=1 Tax=Providencia burhodogranariea DSM 19968 TaxID=1141662 RepID=K8W6C7_9GAMM|nr:universal stress protein UspB [Providencia burhodogranariea]EKT56114.1 universal stress protein UspB [Providencia burhodogranariea DSM 19968]